LFSQVGDRHLAGIKSPISRYFMHQKKYALASERIRKGNTIKKIWIICSCAPNEVRTRVSAMNPLHGDERTEETKTRLKWRE
jgi:hypothetical protein